MTTERQNFGSAARALARLDRLGVPDLEILYRLERTSGQLYEQLADGVGIGEAADALRRNARGDAAHLSPIAS